MPRTCYKVIRYGLLFQIDCSKVKTIILPILFVLFLWSYDCVTTVYEGVKNCNRDVITEGEILQRCQLSKGAADVSNGVTNVLQTTKVSFFSTQPDLS